MAKLGRHLDEGSEHRVYYDEGSGSAIKVTYPGRCGNAFPRGEFDGALPEEYCRRWIAYNDLFGDHVELLGATKSEQGLSLVISQRWIVGERPAIEDIQAYMASLGFSQAASLSDYYRDADQIAVVDAHQDNYVLAGGQTVVPIDVHVLLLDAALKRALCP